MCSSDLRLKPASGTLEGVLPVDSEKEPEFSVGPERLFPGSASSLFVSVKVPLLAGK